MKEKLEELAALRPDLSLEYLHDFGANRRCMGESMYRRGVMYERIYCVV